MQHRDRPHRVVRFTGAVVVLLLSAAAGHAFDFVKTADQDTHVPGNLTGTFTSVGIPILHQRQVVFTGISADGEGIYRSRLGRLGKIADTEDLIPSSFGGRFNRFLGELTTDGSRVAFTMDNFLSERGVYVANGFDVVAVANIGTEIPFASGARFNFFGSPEFHGGDVLFTGTDGGQFRVPTVIGAYRDGPGTNVARVYDDTTTIPGAPAPFTASGQLYSDANSDRLVLFGKLGAGSFGVHVLDGAGNFVRTVADGTIPIPGNPNGTGFGFLIVGELQHPTIDHDQVAFVHEASGSRGRGVYAEYGGVLTRVVDHTTTFPGTTDDFGLFDAAARQGDNVVFQAGGRTNPLNNNALFLFRGSGPLETIVRRGDTVDGKTVAAIGFDRRGLDGTDLAVRLSFTDGTNGIYSTTIGPPVPLPPGNCRAEAVAEAPRTSAGVSDGFPVVDPSDRETVFPFGPSTEATAQISYPAPGLLHPTIEGQSSASVQSGLKAHTRIEVPLPVETPPRYESVVSRVEASCTRRFLHRLQPGAPQPPEVEIDIGVSIDGTLDLFSLMINNPFLPGPVDLWARVEYRTIVHTAAGPVPVLELLGRLRIDGNGQFDLDASGPWAASWTELDPLPGGDPTYTVSYDGTHTGVYSVPFGQAVHIEGLLVVEVFGNIQAAAYLAAADFGNTALFRVETNTPGVVLEEAFEEVVNRRPLADAGGDRLVECQGPEGAVVPVGGAGTTDPDGDELTCSWSSSACSFAAADACSTEATCPPGDHEVRLDATDGELAAEGDVASIVVVDETAPVGAITAPGSPGLCTAGPVTIEDDFHDACGGGAIEREYAPGPGPQYADHGDHDVTLTVRDAAGNEGGGQVQFTIDTAPPTVSIQPPLTGGLLPGEFVPFEVVFATADDDGAAGGVVHESIYLDECRILDGNEHGSDPDGLLSDETIVLDRAELCRIARACGLPTLDRPQLRVEAVDCAGNVGRAAVQLDLAGPLRPGICGDDRVRRDAPAEQRLPRRHRQRAR